MQYRSYLGLVFADFVLSHYLSSTFESEPFNLFKVVVLSEIKLFFSKKDNSINISGQDSGLNSTLIFRVPDTEICLYWLINFVMSIPLVLTILQPF